MSDCSTEYLPVNRTLVFLSHGSFKNCNGLTNTAVSVQMINLPKQLPSIVLWEISNPLSEMNFIILIKQRINCLTVVEGLFCIGH